MLIYFSSLICFWIFTQIANSYLIGDSQTFRPSTAKDHLIQVTATDVYNITHTLSYILPVQNPVTILSATVSPSRVVINDESIQRPPVISMTYV